MVFVLGVQNTVAPPTYLIEQLGKVGWVECWVRVVGEVAGQVNVGLVTAEWTLQRHVVQNADTGQGNYGRVKRMNRCRRI